MPSATFTPASGATLDFNSHNGTSGILFLGMDGDGLPELDHQTVVTPNRDGETYVRTRLPPRFPVAHFLMQHTTRANLYALRRTAIAALNPKLGVGTLSYTPVDGGTTYSINALAAGEVSFDSNVGPFAIEVKAPFRCPDPGWRAGSVNAPTLAIPNGGVSMPLSIPLHVTATSLAGVITNTGDLDSYPVVTAAGPFVGLTLTNVATVGGVVVTRKVSFPGLAVTATQTLTIDMDARTATVLDTAPTPDTVTNVMPFRSNDSASWPLVPGANTVTAQTSVGGTTVTLQYWTRLAGI